MASDDQWGPLMTQLWPSYEPVMPFYDLLWLVMTSYDQLWTVITGYHQLLGPVTTSMTNSKILARKGLPFATIVRLAIFF